jgi:hypothetical protein
MAGPSLADLDAGRGDKAPRRSKHDLFWAATLPLPLALTRPPTSPSYLAEAANRRNPA